MMTLNDLYIFVHKKEMQKIFSLNSGNNKVNLYNSFSLKGMVAKARCCNAWLRKSREFPLGP